MTLPLHNLDKRKTGRKDWTLWQHEARRNRKKRKPNAVHTDKVKTSLLLAYTILLHPQNHPELPSRRVASAKES